METATQTSRRVQILPLHIVNRIAAGEVVERPASVVKELVENALDAGATRIDVSASAGGRMIRVADNGHGMAPEDAQLAFFNHATSKITEDSDLSRIETLGFRGEALASISAISRLTCLTRTPEAASGSKVTLDEEGNPTITDTGCAPGTIMEVADLFYNTPARLKFLKRPQTELGHIEEMVQNLALSHPHVQFSLTLNEKPALKTSGSGDLKLTIEEVFQHQRESLDLLPFQKSDEDAGFAVRGFTSSPGITKGSKRWVITFVNGRSVRCQVLAKAIESAFESLVPHGRYPVSVVYLTLPPDEVDVNVHPTKKEVRYVSTNTVFSFVRNGIKDALTQHGFSAYHTPSGIGEEHHPTQTTALPLQGGMFTPKGGGTPPRSPIPIVSNPHPNPQRMLSRPEPRHELESQQALNFYKPFYKPVDQPESSQTDKSQPEKFKVIGQLFNTYILLETAQGLMVVDQHIASERTFFESLSRNMLAEEPTVQKLVTSVPLSITPTQQDLLASHQGDFAKLGFYYELAPGSVALSGVPIIYQGREPKHLFESLLTQLEETGEMKLDLDHLIATLSCHSAVRAGDHLDHAEMTEVIRQWLACTLPWTCPHGRPIAHTIKTEDLNNFFHRPSLPVNAF